MAVSSSKRHDPTFAVAFGGGGARGLAHIHVIDALDELGIRPVAVSGASIGAIMAAGVAAGMSGQDIRDYAVGNLGNSSEVASRIWRSRPETLSDLFKGGMRLGQFNIERVLRAFLPEDIPETFEELHIPLKIVATDYFAHREVVFSHGSLFPALSASAALPAVFRPIRYQGRLLIDGGMVNPIPFDLVSEHADIVIAVDVIGAPEKNDRPPEPGSIELLFGASQIMMETIVALKLQQVRPQILLRPSVSRFGVLDFLKVEKVMADTAYIKDELKRAIDDAVARFHDEIEPTGL